MKKKDALMLGLPYLVFNLILFIMFLSNYFFLSRILGDLPSYLRVNYGINGFFFLTIIIYHSYPLGFLFILISGGFLYLLKIRKSVLFGIIGTIIYAITVYFFTLVYIQEKNLQLLILIFFWVVCSILNLILLSLLKLYKKELKKDCFRSGNEIY